MLMAMMTQLGSQARLLARSMGFFFFFFDENNLINSFVIDDTTTRPDPTQLNPSRSRVQANNIFIVVHPSIHFSFVKHTNVSSSSLSTTTPSPSINEYEVTRNTFVGSFYCSSISFCNKMAAVAAMMVELSPQEEVEEVCLLRRLFQ